jgi:MSHA biogenesis protein MshJ
VSVMNHWHAWDKRFSVLKNQERRLIVCAGLLCCVLLMYVFAIEPAVLHGTRHGEELTRQRAELVALQKDVAALQERLRDPDAASKRELEAIQSDLGQLDAGLKQYDALLVPPERMTQLLRNLLGKYPGLKLASLKTQAPVPIAGRVGKLIGMTPGKTAQPVPDSLASMYRHGIEITLSGAYPDLLSYAEELQRVSPRPLWSGMQLKVVEYPRSELTFVLYTLSLDPTWLAV